MDADPRVRVPVLIELSSPVAGQSLDERRRAVVRALLEMIPRDQARAAGIEVTRRFVAAGLLTAEIDRLTDRFHDTHLSRVWRNPVKTGQMTASAATVQATTARLGYKASGERVAWAVLDSGVNAGHPHFHSPDHGGTIAAQWDATWSDAA